MSNALTRGWSMARESFTVLRRYPKLAVFPVISGLMLLGLLVAIGTALMPLVESIHPPSPGSPKQPVSEEMKLEFYAVAFAVYYVLTAVIVFCNVALIHCALRCHAGETPSVRAGLAAAVSRLPQILSWALVAAVVGVALHALEVALRKKIGFLATWLIGMLGFAWSVATYFVVPVLASEGLGPVAAVRRSSQIVKSKWGEQIGGQVRFSLLWLLFILQAAALFALGLAIIASRGIGGFGGIGPVLMLAGLVYALAATVVLHALNAIFLSGVYLYARTGTVPATFDRQLMEEAFLRKR